MTRPANYVHYHWAKSDRKSPERIHLLEHHLADVGACLETLLAQPTIHRRMAHTGGLDDLHPATIARLSLFAALHDIGKLHIGFQAKVWQQVGIPRWLLSARKDSSHTLDLVPVVNWQDAETAEWFFAHLGIDKMMTWDADDGSTVSGLLMATFSHHGRPLQIEGGRSRNSQIWRDFGDLSPHRCAERIGELLREWFPDAFRQDAPPLPSAPAFQHMFLGLCTLADWIGSNESFFPYVDTPQDGYIRIARERAKRAIAEIGLDISEQRQKFIAVPGHEGLFGFKPNAIQRAAQEASLEQPIVTIESETGSGKTEAALWRFARMYENGLVDGIYFALPTRAAAVQIHGRMRRFAANLFAGQGVPPVVLAIPGYDADADADRVRMHEYDEHAAGERHHEQPWASDNPKKYLAAQIAVGTIDQAMMGALKVRHAHMRAACLARSLLVVDEVHASDAYMRRILEALLEAHIGAGGYALLMSATLGSDARCRLLSAGGASDINETLPLGAAIKTPYPAISASGAGTDKVGENGRTKTVRMSAYPIMPDFDAVSDIALNAARAGAKVLVVRNTVGHAIQMQQALERLAGERDNGLLFNLNGVNTLHHGRFSAHDRRLLDCRVEAYLGKDAGRGGAGCVVVGTQTLEQSLDIDADLLLTDLCPVDVLLQRIGRLHRHERDDRPADYRTPACIVLTPPDNDLSSLLERGQNPNGLGQYGGVYEDLRILEATLRLIERHGVWDIPRMNRELVERATHPDALGEIVVELGEAWQIHAIKLTGKLQADQQFAEGAIVRRNKCFYGEDGEDNHEVRFDSDEEDIRTRLGEARLDIEFVEPQNSPFDQSAVIDKVVVPARWLPKDAQLNKGVNTTIVDDGFEFAVGDRGFRYDRLGLHRLQRMQP